MSVAQIGHNSRSFNQEEKLPPKRERIIDKTRARQIEIAVTITAKLCRLSKTRVMAKRKSGEEGRFVRQFSLFYADGLSSPRWESSLIFGLNRKQVGEEISAFIEMLARNPQLEEETEKLISACDWAIRFNHKAFIKQGVTERMADAAARRAIETAKEAADLLALPPPPPPSRLPKPKPVSAEVEALVRAGQEKRRQQQLDQAEAILDAVIAKGEAQNATKQQKKDAADARKAKAEIHADRAKKRARK